MILALLLAAALCPHPHRNKSLIALFARTHPCPTTCQTYVKRGKKLVKYERCGACQVDHACPLAACGADALRNLRWLDKKENNAKSDDPGLCTPDLLDPRHAWKVESP